MQNFGETMNILIMTPCGSESEVLQKHIDSIKSVEHKLSVVFVIDTYTDKATREILKRNESERFFALDIGKSKGLANCYIEGYKYFLKSEYDFIIEMDIDSHKKEDLLVFLEKIREGHKIIFGSRTLGKNESSVKRRLISKIGTILSRLFLGLKLSDCTGGFQAFSKEVIESIKLDEFYSKSFLFQTEMKLKALRIPTDEALQEASSTIETEKYNVIKIFSWQQGFKYEYIEIPIKYENSKSSLNTKLIFKSFIEFISLSINKNNMY